MNMSSSDSQNDKPKRGRLKDLSCRQVPPTPPLTTPFLWLSLEWTTQYIFLLFSGLSNPLHHISYRTFGLSFKIYLVLSSWSMDFMDITSSSWTRSILNERYLQLQISTGISFLTPVIPKKKITRKSASRRKGSNVLLLASRPFELANKNINPYINKRNNNKRK